MPFNYSQINNYAVAHTDAEVIGLVNNDIEVISNNWLDEMVANAIRPEVGCVGAKLNYPNDTVQHAGVIIGLGGVAGHSHKHFDRDAVGYFGRLVVAQNLSAVTAACLLVRRDVFLSVDGLNEEKLAVAFNDVDFCLKVRQAGYLNVWTPFAELYHHESVSRGSDVTPDKIKRFMGEISYMKETWKTHKNADEYYNKNLSLNVEDFSYSKV